MFSRKRMLFKSVFGIFDRSCWDGGEELFKGEVDAGGRAGVVGTTRSSRFFEIGAGNFPHFFVLGCLLI